MSHEDQPQDVQAEAIAEAPQAEPSEAGPVEGAEQEVAGEGGLPVAKAEQAAAAEPAE
jgi:hypothetical protein